VKLEDKIQIDSLEAPKETLSSCVLCGELASVSFEPYCKISGYHIIQCKNCKLIFVNPRDNQETILKQYPNDETSPISYYLRTERVDTINFNKRLDWIEKKVATGKLLDIGCSVGTYMNVARNRGWNVS